MKTKEFIKRVNELGYYVEIDSDTVIKCDGCTLARINERRPYKMNANAMVEVKDAKELFDLCVEYARTPIKERKDVKKYYLYLKNKNREFYESIYSYLTLRKQDNTFSLDVGVETAGLTAEFTQEKIDWIKERFNTDLEEFEQIEVKE